MARRKKYWVTSSTVIFLFQTCRQNFDTLTSPILPQIFYGTRSGTLLVRLFEYCCNHHMEGNWIDFFKVMERSKGCQDMKKGRKQISILVQLFRELEFELLMEHKYHIRVE